MHLITIQEGDIPGFPRPGRPKWHDIETPVSDVVGKVEVAVLNHHGNEDGTNENFLGIYHLRMS